MPDLDVYAPFDAGAGANVTEDTWRKFMLHMLGSASGVIRGFDNNMATTGDSSGMQVKVATGQAWMRGHFGQNTSVKTVAIAAAPGANSRIDRIVLRVDFIANKVSVNAVTGTVAASPVAPAVTQNTSLWETSLALVAVGTSVVTITAGNVTDDRVYTTCGASYARTAGSPQTVATNSEVGISFTGANFMSADVVAAASGHTFTLNRAGLYTLSFRLGFATNGTGIRQAKIVDPVTPTNIYMMVNQSALAGVPSYLSGTCTFRFAAGSQIQTTGFQSSGGNLNTDSAQVDIVWIGP